MATMRFSIWSACLFLLCAGCSQGNSPAGASTSGDGSLERVRKSGVLTWGADVIGGEPYVFEDPKNKGTYVGFEMDIARGISRHLGVEQKMVIKAWDTLIPELQKGTFDIAMNGIENLPERQRILLLSDPYYVYSQQITVRKNTDGVKSLEDLKGRKIATLSGTAAEDILRRTPGIFAQINPEIIYSYRDLEAGRVDAVLLDTPIAAAYGAKNPKLKNVGESFAEGEYVIALRREEQALWDAVNRALKNMKEQGELKAIYLKWGIMDRHQERIGVR
jgi:polar amino acid transport system substrate-binding protein